MAKVGRPRKVEKPDDMLDMFKAYKTYVKENPRYKYVMNQRSGDMVAEPLEVPLTLEGFEIWTLNKFGFHIEQYFKNVEKRYEEFVPICTHIRKEIRRDQIEGGMVGQYNASITQRLNGLTEKVESTIITEQPLFPDVQENDSDK
jgi:hypothetical protein